ncbi:MAG TPA: type II secretion system F family protein [Caulobacterales bacterium]|nr:type II secretion system F family protein [Caulobacterales bacterium]
MDPAVIGAVLAFVAIGGVGYAFMAPGQSAKAQKRVKAVAGVKPDRRKAQAEMQALKRRQSTQEALKELTLNEKQSRKRRVSVKGQIEQAGLTLSVTTFWIMSGALGGVLALVGFIVQHGLLGAAIGLFVGALGLPRWLLSVFVGARQKKFSNQLADAIDVIVRGVKSGLPLSQCLRIIAAESPEPLRTEFQQLVDAQAMGVPLDQTMQRMFDRMPLPEVNFFSIVLVIQQKTGGNLSESLGNLSSVLRSRKLMKEKVKALSAEAKASAMIIGALPLIVMGMVYITRPQYMMILFTNPTGHLILLVSAVMMALGIIIMRNMVNFKF